MLEEKEETAIIKNQTVKQLTILIAIDNAEFLPLEELEEL